MAINGSSDAFHTSREGRAWLRRLAVQLVAQLPDEPADARFVIQEVGRLFNGFVMIEPLPEEPAMPANVGDAGKPRLQIIKP